MPADASIYNMLRPVQAGPGPLDQYAQGLQLRHLLDQSDMSQLQRKQLMKQMQDEEATGAAYQEARGDPAKVRDLLYGKGLYKPAMAAEKALLETQEKKGSIAKTGIETHLKQAEYLRDRLATVQDQAGYDQWIAEGARLYGPEAAKANPPQFSPQVKEALLMKASDVIERIKPKFSVQDFGGTKGVVQENPLATGGVTGMQPKTQTPGERDASARGWASLNETKAEHGRVAVRAAEAAKAGKIPPGYRTTQDGSLEPIPGGPADAKEAKKVDDTKKVVDMYVAARDGVMSGLEGSMTGPIIGRGIPFTAKQQIAEGSVAAMAPVLKQLFRVAGEGVFTDRDQALLLDMVPKRTDEPEARKEKMANIDKIVAAKLGMEVPARAQQESKGKIGDAPIRISGDDGYNALPKGALYVGPDGVTRRK